MSKDHGRHVDLLRFVLHHWDTLPVIPDPDLVVLPGKGKSQPFIQNAHTHARINLVNQS